jgi:hypothetical protein
LVLDVKARNIPYAELGIMLSGVSAMVRPENVENDLDVARTIADTPPLN